MADAFGERRIQRAAALRVCGERRIQRAAALRVCGERRINEQPCCECSRREYEQGNKRKEKKGYL